MFNYKFPIINTLDDVLPAINGRTEFVVAERDWGFVANYNVNLIDTFPRANTKDDELNELYRIRRECRGIKFDPDGKILARPFHKFFNLNERPETDANAINWSSSFKIMQKLDGSMAHPIYHDGLVRWCTKMGYSDVAEYIQQFADTNPVYNEFANMMMSIGKTPLFEFCSLKNRIIIRHDQDKMVLLAIRDNVTGEYSTLDEMKHYVNKRDIPIVDLFGDDFSGINSFLTDVQAREGEEGYVIRFDDGHMTKVKNLWYVQLHKTKELMTWEKDVWRLVLTDTFDDAKAFMEQEDKDRLDRFATDFNNIIDELASDVKWIAIELQDNYNSRKQQAQVIMQKHKELASIIFKVLDGEDPRAIIVKRLLDSCTSSTKVNEIRNLVKGLNWEDYNVV